MSKIEIIEQALKDKSDKPEKAIFIFKKILKEKRSHVKYFIFTSISDKKNKLFYKYFIFI